MWHICAGVSLSGQFTWLSYQAKQQCGLKDWIGLQSYQMSSEFVLYALTSCKLHSQLNYYMSWTESVISFSFLFTRFIFNYFSKYTSQANWEIIYIVEPRYDKLRFFWIFSHRYFYLVYRYFSCTHIFITTNAIFLWK